jgi:putative transposase
MCKILEVSKGNYYKWLKEPVSEMEKANCELLEKIKEIHQGSKQTYGSPRIVAELIKQGINAGHNRVARLMRENEITPEYWRPVSDYRNKSKNEKKI